MTERRLSRDSPIFKVFGIGLSRTGTTSLARALRKLGFRTSHYPHDRTTEAELFEADGTLSLLRYYDAVVDVSVAPFYTKLDLAYPTSRFVLTVRDVESWLVSMRRHISRLREDWDELTPQYRKFTRRIIELAYGTMDFDPTAYRKAYLNHTSAVTGYFQNREDDLLVLDVSEDSSWKRLSRFLDRSVPSEPFPHANEGASRWSMVAGWNRRMRSVAAAIQETIPEGASVAVVDGFQLEEEVISRVRLVAREGQLKVRNTRLEIARPLGEHLNAEWLVVAWTSKTFSWLDEGLLFDGWELVFADSDAKIFERRR